MSNGRVGSGRGSGPSFWVELRASGAGDWACSSLFVPRWCEHGPVNLPSSMARGRIIVEKH